MPQNSGDPGITPNDPRAILQMLAQGHLQGSGTTSVGPQIPNPQPIGNPIPQTQQSGVPQGSFASKGAHQRASLQNLSGSVQNLVSTAVSIHQQQENKQLGQKFTTLTGSVKGVQAADEMAKNAQALLQADPNSVQGKQMQQQAQEMKQHNTTILNQLLDPNTPDGKKNIKLFNKGFGLDDKNADTPERAAAIQAMKSQSQNSTQSQTPAQALPGAMGGATQVPGQAGPQVSQQGSGLNEGAAKLLSQMPTGLQMSPQTQQQAEMVKAGLQPKAATGTAVLSNQEKSAQGLVTDQQKNDALQQKEAMQRERLGLDDNGNPKPLSSLPPAMQAKVASERATDDLKAAQAAYAQARSAALQDPHSAQNQLALMRAGAMAKFASASMLRAQVGLLNYRMNSTSTGEDGKPIPGSMTVNGQTIGKAYAAQVGNEITKQAQFTDVDGSIDKIAAAAKELHDSGQALNDPKLVKILGNPHFRAGDNAWFNNEVNSQLLNSMTSQQRDYIVAQRQAVENMSALRGMLKSGVSQKQMDNIVNTVPGAQTPDFDYAMRQIQAVRGQLTRLRSGVPNINIPGRPNQPGATGAPPAPDQLTGDINKALQF